MPRIDVKLMAATALLLALASCARHENAGMSSASAPERARAADADAQMAKGGAEPATAGLQTPGVDAGQFATSTGTTNDPRRRFVRTADASFQVENVYASTLAIEDAVAAEGGFVVRNQVQSQVVGRHVRALGDGLKLELSEVATSGSLVVRIPSERTQPFLRAIAKRMQFLDARTFEANDVQFEILRKQLAHARAQELQQDVRAAAARPGKVGDQVDALQARADMLGARDEALVGERELEDRIAFSTLSLELSQPAQVREQTVPDTEAILRDRGPGFFAQVRDALVAGWRGLLQALLAAVYLWPLWLLVAAGWWLFRGLRRWRRTRPAPASQSPQQ